MSAIDTIGSVCIKLILKDSGDKEYTCACVFCEALTPENVKAAFERLDKKFPKEVK